MELTGQLANLEDEIKLLKGEIRSILKEIRAAVLNSDNPFSNPATLQKINQTAAAPVEAAEAPAHEEPTPFAPRPVEVGQPALQPAPVLETPFAQPVPVSAIPDEPQESPRTNLLTIAALLVWAEDAIGALGARRFRFMLELAFFSELLSPEVRDVLRDASELWAKEGDADQPVSVNECLLQLRQLEAIVNGERVERLPRRRAKRRSA